MKRIYLLLIYFASVISANAQALLNEGFEGSTFPPPNWTLINGAAPAAYDWAANDDPSLIYVSNTGNPYPAHSGTGSMVYEYSETDDANAWAITPSLNLTSGVSYTISFYYRVAVSSYPERLKVTVGNDSTIAAQSTVLWNNNGGTELTNAAWALGKVNYTATSTGKFNFGFNCYSAANMFALIVDDISIEVTANAVPGCTTNVTPANAATGVGLNPLTLIWHTSPTASAYDIYIGTTNPPTAVIANGSDTIANLSGGTFDTTYYWYVVPKNSAGSAIGCVSSVTSFTTAPPPAAPACATILSPLNNATNVDVNPVFSWNTVPGATSYIVSLGYSDPPDTLGAVTDTSVTLNQPLDFGTTYYWSVVPQNAGGAAADCPVYSFTTRNAAAVPANDDVCNAIALTLNGPSDCENTEGATTAPSDTLSCSTENNTVWYKYTPATSGPVTIKMKRTLSAGTDLDAWLGVFTTSGSCPNLNFSQVFDCYHADLSADDSVLVVTGFLTANTPYYIMVDGYSGAVGEFCISLQNPPAPPACTTLIAPANGATNVSAPAVNFSWNATAGATSYVFSIGTSNPPDSLVAISDTTIGLQGIDFNTTYYWSAVPQNGGGTATGCAVDSFTTGEAPAPPTNDECTGAIPITAYAPVNGTTISATQSLAADSCSNGLGDANDDVWFKFTALQAGSATITVTTNGAFDAVVEAYSGNCGALQSIGCKDASFGTETITLSNLVAGTTYYLRVFGFGPELTEGTFTITAAGAALPVNLVNFKGEQAGSVNVLSWTTETERNNKGFELQRSIDGKNYSTLRFVQSQALNGNSSSRLNYTATDEKPFAGNTYYRLRQVDIDGKATLSNVVLIKGARPNALVLSNVYPNPARAELKVVLGAPVNDRVNIVITDMAGKIVIQKFTQVITGDNNISFNVSTLPSGSYMIKAICASGCETSVSKFVKE